jgi:hypothetical protein
MTASDSTAKHLETLATGGQGGEVGDHVLEVSGHGHEVVAARAAGLRGRELADLASGRSDGVVIDPLPSDPGSESEPPDEGGGVSIIPSP